MTILTNQHCLKNSRILIIAEQESCNGKILSLSLPKLLVFAILFCFSLGLFAQTQVKGKVVDSRSGEPLPFVNVFFTGTSLGTTTDFDGFYQLKGTKTYDSLSVSYVGYETMAKALKKTAQSQVLNFQLKEKADELLEVVIKPGENPAVRIINEAKKRRPINDYEALKAFQYESFTKVQLAVDQLSDKDKKRKLFKDILPVFDTVAQLTDGGVNPVLPIFISETLSDFYVIKSPLKQKEIIKASKVIGVGLQEGSPTSQLLGSTFQQYNFHKNWVRILEKDFISPVGDAANSFYVFTLKDTVFIDGYKCFKIECNPKRPADLAFTGTIWVADSFFAIKRLQFFMDKRANLNFLDQFKIQQEYERSNSGAWVPQKTRILLNLDEPTSTTPGAIALFYVSNKNIITNEPKEAKFYDEQLVLLDDALHKSDSFWNDNRHEQLTEGDKKVMKMIDTLKNLPTIKNWVDFINIVVSGYKRVGKIDIGPYAFLLGYNPLEGVRARIGFRTNYLFSEQYILRAYGAYGFLDKRFKYSAQIDWFVHKKSWSVLGIKYRNDVDQIGVTDQNYEQSNLFTSLALVQASQINRTVEGLVWFSSQYSSSWSQRLTLHSKSYVFQPIGDIFNFAFFENVGQTYNPISRDFQTTTLTLETKFSYRENFVKNRNERISLGAQKGPEIILNLTKGFEGLFNGEFNYEKLNLTLEQWLRMGRLGEGKYRIIGAKVFGTLPYPILDVQRGNQSFIASSSTYNLMNLFEFVCDQYVAVSYEQHFGGSVFDRLPMMKKLKLRFLAGAKGVWGSISDANLALLPKVDESGRDVTQFYMLNKEPYVEVSYGIENILSFGRVDFIHRVSHLSNPGISPFGVKISAQFTF